MAETTPMMRQYLDIKRQHTDKIVFFRLGDFYEMFRDDAVEASGLLGLTLTHRQDEPMCGIPYHSAPTYIRRLLEAGRRIAICEQVSVPGEGKGIVSREVVDILTPGTLVEESYLPDSGNYTLAVWWNKDRGALSVADLSTGDFRTTCFVSSTWKDTLARELARFSPREILVPEDLLETESDLHALLGARSGLTLTTVPPWRWDARSCLRALLDHFSVSSLKAFDLEEDSPAVVTSGVLLTYWRQNSPGRSLGHVQHLQVFQATEFLLMDPDSTRSLDIVVNSRDGGTGFTLYKVLDRCVSTTGRRRLQSWLQFPLKSLTLIVERHEAVSILVEDQDLLGGVRRRLQGILDLERLGARLALDKASPPDLLGIEASVLKALDVAGLLQAHHSGSRFLAEWPQESRELLSGDAAELSRVLLREPASILSEGGLIQPGVSSELDELRHLRDHSQEVLEGYLVEEQQAHGLPQLRLKNNRIIGYFFEISKAKLDQPPRHFERRQSLLGTERFTTPRLKELEAALSHAQERIFHLERSLFLALRDGLKAHLEPLGQAARCMAQLDAFSSLAQVALEQGYVRPRMTEGSELELLDGRHPVVEANLRDTPFIPNSVSFGARDTLFLITGPNMAGKSTYLRQTALIVLMAQAGSFVPCTSAEIGVIDRIFCRVGASDFLAKGESTFLVEMNETARILRGATPRSLVIMDEVGRGTGTRDGFSLAWAICEYLLDSVRAKTLFATHFHELTALEHPAMSNFSMAVDDNGDRVVFLRRVVPGASDNSYGLHVARFAGVPHLVVDRAAEILQTLPPEQGLPGSARPQPAQFDLFAPEPRVDWLRDELRSIDPDQLTPLQALGLVASWKQKASD